MIGGRVQLLRIVTVGMVSPERKHRRKTCLCLHCATFAHHHVKRLCSIPRIDTAPHTRCGVAKNIHAQTFLDMAH